MGRNFVFMFCSLAIDDSCFSILRNNKVSMSLLFLQQQNSNLIFFIVFQLNRWKSLLHKSKACVYPIVDHGFHFLIF